MDLLAQPTAHGGDQPGHSERHSMMGVGRLHASSGLYIVLPVARPVAFMAAGRLCGPAEVVLHAHGHAMKAELPAYRQQVSTEVWL